MLHYLLPWVAVILNISGLALTIRCSRWGFIVGGVGNLYWLWTAYEAHNTPLLVSVVAFTLAGLYGFYEWSQKR